MGDQEIVMKKRPKRFQHSFVIGGQQSQCSPLNISKIQKSLLLLHMLKVFQSTILPAKERQMQQTGILMHRNNVLLERIYHQGKETGVLKRHSIVSAVVNKTPNLILTSQIVLDRLDINGNEKQVRLEKENCALLARINRMERILESAGQKKTVEEWNQYLQRLGQRVQKRSLQLAAKEYKCSEVKKEKDYVVQSSSEESIDVSSVAETEKLTKQCENSVNHIRKSIQLRNIEMSNFLNQIKDFNIPNKNNLPKKRRSWKQN